MAYILCLGKIPSSLYYIEIATCLGSQMAICRVASVVDRSLNKYTHILLLFVYGLLLDVWINNTGVPKKMFSPSWEY